MRARSSVITRFVSKISGTLPLAISWARPSTMAVLPTPASPSSTGLFFVRRQRIWMTRSISFLRPMTGVHLAFAGDFREVTAKSLECGRFDFALLFLGLGFFHRQEWTIPRFRSSDRVLSRRAGGLLRCPRRDFSGPGQQCRRLRGAVRAKDVRCQYMYG